MSEFSRYDVPVFGITGWKNSGKTLLTTRLISYFSELGLRVGAIKHAHHSFEIDHEGRDSYLMREAGARQIAVVSKYRWALVAELVPEHEPDFETILGQFKGFDLVLVEGYKQLAFPKIEARSSFQETRQKLSIDRPDIVAVASDDPHTEDDLPLFEVDDISTIAGFIAKTLALKLKQL
ncbi:MAG: molybdopterin-guanine dinucleotide biosynthesis protein B [bacterium]|nr:molybdopterin-guanine dinucleotide biosynthesis protein B [bacterium]